jgi:hypothetical protein
MSVVAAGAAVHAAVFNPDGVVAALLGGVVLPWTLAHRPRQPPADRRGAPPRHRGRAQPGPDAVGVLGRLGAGADAERRPEVDDEDRRRHRWQRQQGTAARPPGSRGRRSARPAAVAALWTRTPRVTASPTQRRAARRSYIVARARGDRRDSGGDPLRSSGRPIDVGVDLRANRRSRRRVTRLQLPATSRWGGPCSLALPDQRVPYSPSPASSVARACRPRVRTSRARRGLRTPASTRLRV